MAPVLLAEYSYRHVSVPSVAAAAAAVMPIVGDLHEFGSIPMAAVPSGTRRTQRQGSY